MESKKDDAANAADAHLHKPLPERISSGEGAASALSRLRTMEQAVADSGLGAHGQNPASADPP